MKKLKNKEGIQNYKVGLYIPRHVFNWLRDKEAETGMKVSVFIRHLLIKTKAGEK